MLLVSAASNLNFMNLILLPSKSFLFKMSLFFFYYYFTIPFNPLISLIT